MQFASVMATILRRTARALGRDRNGAVAAEFGIIAPMIGIIAVGAIDLGQLANEGLVLDAALRAGGGYALKDPTNTTAITSYIQNYATFSGIVTVTFTPPTGYADSSGFAAPEYCTCDNGAAIACDPSIATCTSGPTHYYVAIKLTEAGLSPILPWVGFPTSISRSLTVRVL